MSKAWNAFDRWMRDNGTLVMLALAIASVTVWWNVRSVYDDETNLHSKDCESARARSVDVQTFWQSTADKRQSHAQHEAAASTLWATIVGDLARDHVGGAKLARDIAGVSNTWTGLSDDDFANADLARQYAQQVAADFTASCGVAPTPRAPATNWPTPRTFGPN